MGAQGGRHSGAQRGALALRLLVGLVVLATSCPHTAHADFFNQDFANPCKPVPDPPPSPGQQQPFVPRFSSLSLPSPLRLCDRRRALPAPPAFSTGVTDLVNTNTIRPPLPSGNASLHPSLAALPRRRQLRTTFLTPPCYTEAAGVPWDSLPSLLSSASPCRGRPVVGSWGSIPLLPLCFPSVSPRVAVRGCGICQVSCAGVQRAHGPSS